MDVAGLLTYLKMTSRGDVIDKALDITLSLTNQKNFQVSWGKVPGATHQLVVLACAREHKSLSLKASKCLVNLSEDLYIRKQIVDEDGIKLCVGKLKDVDSEEQQSLYVSLLANLTKDKKPCESFVEENKGEDIEFFFQKYLSSTDEKTKEPVFQHGGYVLTNITQFDFGRKWLVSGVGDKLKRYKCLCLPKYKRMNARDGPSSTAKPTGNFVYHGDIIEAIEEKDDWVKHANGWTAQKWSGLQILYPFEANFKLMIGLTSSKNSICRLSAFQSIRNCSLDKKIITKDTVIVNNLLERLLLPLVVPVLYNQKDRDGMFSKVVSKNEILNKNEAKRGKQVLKDKENPDNNSALVEDVAIKKAILETLLQFAQREDLRQYMDSKRTYIILRELHTLETVKEVIELIIHVQNMFILDNKCLQQPRDEPTTDPNGKGENSGGFRVENEVWTSPDGPLWNSPVDHKAITAANKKREEVNAMKEKGAVHSEDKQKEKAKEGRDATG